MENGSDENAGDGTGDRIRRAIGLLTAWTELDDDPSVYQRYLTDITSSDEEVRQTVAGLVAVAGSLLVLLVGKSPVAQRSMLERIARDWS